jgi:signal transduction histidine kinase
MPGSAEVRPFEPRAVDLCARGRSLLLDRLRERWSEIPDAITRYPEIEAEFLEHACLILDLVGHELAGAASGPSGKAAEVGRSRARQHVHPIDSVRAAAVVHDAVVETTCELLAPGHVDVALVRRVARACVNVMLQVLVDAAEGHVGALLHEVVDSHAAERRRIARELHDRTGHSMAVAQRQVELARALRRSTAATPDEIDAALALALTSVRDSMEGVRAMITGLREDDPAASFAELVDSYLEHNPCTARMRTSITGDERRVPAPVRRETFLMVRELLRNAQRHSKASRIDLTIAIGAGAISITVADNGIGLDADHEPGAGIASLLERSQLLGARIEFLPTPGGGTTVLLTVPLLEGAGTT